MVPFPYVIPFYKTSHLVRNLRVVACPKPSRKGHQWKGWGEMMRHIYVQLRFQVDPLLMVKFCNKYRCQFSRHLLTMVKFCKYRCQFSRHPLTMKLFSLKYKYIDLSQKLPVRDFELQIFIQVTKELHLSRPVPTLKEPPPPGWKYWTLLNFNAKSSNVDPCCYGKCI